MDVIIPDWVHKNTGDKQSATEMNKLAEAVRNNALFTKEKLEGLTSGIDGEVNTSMSSTALNDLPNGVYRAKTSGVYNFSPSVVMGTIDGVSIANNTVPEGYMVLFKKSDEGWGLLQAVKMPDVPIDEIEEEIELVRDYSVKNMLMNADFLIKDNVVLNSDGIPQAYNITWADGEEGEVVLSNYDSNVLEYKDMTATYKNLEVVYGTKTYNNDGYVISQLDNVINEL